MGKNDNIPKSKPVKLTAATYATHKGEPRLAGKLIALNSGKRRATFEEWEKLLKKIRGHK